MNSMSLQSPCFAQSANRFFLLWSEECRLRICIWTAGCGISGAEVRWPAVDLHLRSGRIRQRTLPIGADGTLALARLQ
jgi:hypothetical protein